MRKMKSSLFVVLLVLTFAACPNRPASTPVPLVPGAVDQLDAWAFRIIADASASIHSIKTWEQCTEKNFPSSVSIDGTEENCDAKGGQFPMQYKPQLNLAIDALNTASAAGKTYHSGASNDTSGLTNSVTALSNAVTQLLSNLGGKQ